MPITKYSHQKKRVENALKINKLGLMRGKFLLRSEVFLPQIFNDKL